MEVEQNTEQDKVTATGYGELQEIESSVQKIINVLSRCTTKEAVDKVVAYTTLCVAYKGLLLLEGARNPEVESNLFNARHLVLELLSTNEVD